MRKRVIQADNPILLELARNFRDPRRRVQSETGQHIYRLSEPAVEAFLEYMKPTLLEFEAAEEKEREIEQKQRAAEEHARWHGPSQGHSH